MSEVYIVVLAKHSSGDVSGVLADQQGILWGHTSSSMDFLKGDLTTTFTERRMTLEDRYPDGYEVVVLDNDEPLPDVIAAYF